MSKDIRSFFAPIKSKAADAISPNARKEKKKSDGKRRVYNVIESDDDEIEENPIKKVKIDTETKGKKKGTDTSNGKQEGMKLEKEKVDVNKFFGDSPVYRKPQTLIKQENPSEVIKSKVDHGRKKRKRQADVSIEEHFDDEFESSLCLLDEEALGIAPKDSPKIGDKPPQSNDHVLVCKTSPTSKALFKNSSCNSSSENLLTNNPDRSNSNLIQSPMSKDEDAMNHVDMKKKANADAYQRFLNRGGPRNPGSKPIPVGAPNCLQGKSFVITGVLESLERDDAAALVEKYGGRVLSSVSKKTSFIILGDEPGLSKMKKADDLKIPQLSEDGFLDLIKNSAVGHKAEASPEKSLYFEKSTDGIVPSTPKAVSSSKIRKTKEIIIKSPHYLKKNDQPPQSDSGFDSMGSSEKPLPPQDSIGTIATGHSLWVDKYKPKTVKNIIGQNGDRSNVKKLTKWLTDWHKNHGNNDKKKAGRPAPWAQGDDGAFFKAALLSGPPGVGKTTSVDLVCKELGFHMIEFNASDTRSKRLLGEQVAELLGSKTIRGFCSSTGESNSNNKKHVLVMDEVDGMAGNEDRGGVQELILLIKKTKTPIICMCNDRSHPKMRSLVNYCFDLRYNRPRVEQIKGAMMSICCKEGLTISGETLVNIITSANQDIRQVLHNLSLWCVKEKSLSDNQAKLDASNAKKVLKMGPWDVARQVFSQSDQEKMTLRQKEDLFFQDYNLGPLFVQDTYIHAKPFKAKGDKVKTLQCLSRAADCLAWGDVIERKIRSQNAWGLLPTQAYFSSVLPGYEMAGHVMGQITFPAWLGKNSKRGRIDRLLQVLHVHTRLRTSGSKQAVNLDYSQPLRDAILRPLLREGAGGVTDAVAVMNNYHLLREDLDSLIELTQWPNRKDPFASIDSKVKAAFTRAFNKENAATPYAVTALVKKSKQDEGELLEMAMDGENVEASPEDAEEDTEDVASDAMVKKVKSKKEPAKCQKEVQSKKSGKGKTSKTHK